MGRDTKIQWCDSTINLVVGCSGCELYPDHCYANELVRRYAGMTGWPKYFDDPQSYFERLTMAIGWRDMTGQDRPGKPWLNGRPRHVFVNDLGDTFSPAAGKFLTAMKHAIGRMAASSHRWLILTKWPKRMVKFVYEWQDEWSTRFPDNVWLGVSVTDQKTAERRIEDMDEMPRYVNRFVSAEPMLSKIDWRAVDMYAFKWLIIGGESGKNARPFCMDWAGQPLRLGGDNGVDVFIKQLGATPYIVGTGGDRFDWATGFEVKDGNTYLRVTDPKGGDWSEFPDWLKVREVPA